MIGNTKEITRHNMNLDKETDMTILALIWAGVAAVTTAALKMVADPPKNQQGRIQKSIASAILSAIVSVAVCTIILNFFEVPPTTLVGIASLLGYLGNEIVVGLLYGYLKNRVDIDPNE